MEFSDLVYTKCEDTGRAMKDGLCRSAGYPPYPMHSSRDQDRELDVLQLFGVAGWWRERIAK